jgi:hypothetical protein
MAARHVYADPAWLDGERLQEKLAVTRAPVARFASVRFVTGALDPLASRDEWLDLARRTQIPMLMVYRVQTPPRSRAEMEVLAVLGFKTVLLPRGKLSLHEEFVGAAYEAIDSFLREESRRDHG